MLTVANPSHRIARLLVLLFCLLAFDVVEVDSEGGREGSALATGGATTWCSQDSTCRELGDPEAVCNADGTCTCSALYMNVPNIYSEDTGLCQRIGGTVTVMLYYTATLQFSGTCTGELDMEDFLYTLTSGVVTISSASSCVLPFCSPSCVVVATVEGTLSDSIFLDQVWLDNQNYGAPFGDVTAYSATVLSTTSQELCYLYGTFWIEWGRRYASLGERGFAVLVISPTQAHTVDGNAAGVHATAESLYLNWTENGVTYVDTVALTDLTLTSVPVFDGLHTCDGEDCGSMAISKMLSSSLGICSLCANSEAETACYECPASAPYAYLSGGECCSHFVTAACDGGSQPCARPPCADSSLLEVAHTYTSLGNGVCVDIRGRQFINSYYFLIMVSLGEPESRCRGTCDTLGASCTGYELSRGTSPKLGTTAMCRVFVPDTRPSDLPFYLQRSTGTGSGVLPSYVLSSPDNAECFVRDDAVPEADTVHTLLACCAVSTGGTVLTAATFERCSKLCTQLRDCVAVEYNTTSLDCTTFIATPTTRLGLDFSEDCAADTICSLYSFTSVMTLNATEQCCFYNGQGLTQYVVAATGVSSPSCESADLCVEQCRQDVLCSAVTIDTTDSSCVKCFYLTVPSSLDLVTGVCTSAEQNVCYLKTSQSVSLISSPYSLCEAGSLVSTAEACEAAADTLLLSYTVATQPLDSLLYPKGCWMDMVDKKLYFSPNGEENTFASCPSMDGHCFKLCSAPDEAVEVMTWKGCYDSAALAAATTLSGPYKASNGLYNGFAITQDSFCYAMCQGYKYFSREHISDNEMGCYCFDTLPALTEATNCEQCYRLFPDDSSSTVSCVQQRRPATCSRTVVVEGYSCVQGTTAKDIFSFGSCEASCIADLACDYFGWSSEDSTCIHTTGECTTIMNPHFDLYRADKCATREFTTNSIPATMAYPYGFAGESGGQCQAYALNPLLSERTGWCGYSVAANLTCARSTDSGRSSPYPYNGACICPANSFCSDVDGLCQTSTVAPQTQTPAGDAPRSLYNVNGDASVVIGEYVGAGHCEDARGYGYYEYTAVLPSDVGNYFGDAYFENLCRSQIDLLALQACGAVGAMYIGRDAGGPKCALVMTQTTSAFESSTIPYTLTRSGTAIDYPVAGNGTAGVMCFTYLGGQCSVADRCGNCTQSGCTVPEGGTRCLAADGSLCVSPCGDVGYRKVCPSAVRQNHSLLDKPTYTREDPAVVETYFTDDHGDAVEYVYLDDAPTCEASGLLPVDTEEDCRRALCSLADVEYYGSIPDVASVDVAIGNLPLGCSVRCETGTGRLCAFSSASFHNASDVGFANYDCKALHSKNTRCICKREKGSIAAQPPSEPCQTSVFEYAIAVTGFGCGGTTATSLNGTELEPHLVEDVSSGAGCRVAACQFFGLEVGNMPRWGGFPIRTVTGLRPPYTGHFPAGYSGYDVGEESSPGGCSAVRPYTDTTAKPYEVWYVPPNVCPGSPPESCTAARGCILHGDGLCRAIKEGYGLCSYEAPCLCQVRHNPIVVAPTAPQAVVEVEETCPMTTDYWGAGIVHLCDPCKAYVDTFARCGSLDATAPTHELVVTVAGGTTWSHAFNAYSLSDNGEDEPRDTSTFIVKKHVSSGRADMGVMVDGEPDMDREQVKLTSSVARYHCRTPPQSEASSTSCTIPACGPFTVSLTAIEGDANVTISICLPPAAVKTCECANAAADGFVRGECAISAVKRQVYYSKTNSEVDVPTVSCECEENFGLMSLSGELDCTKCAEGQFPTFGSLKYDLDVVPACALSCAQCGTVPCGYYNSTTEVCDCLGKLTGAMCDGACASGLYGMFCNESLSTFKHSFEPKFSNLRWQSPPWRVAPNSDVKVTIADVGQRNKISTIRATVAKQLLSSDAEALPDLPAQSSGLIDAAVYAPSPEGMRSDDSTEYLHVFRSNMVTVYLYEDSRFTFVTEELVSEYFASMELSACSDPSVFGELYDRDYDAVLYKTFSSSVSNEKWMVFIKGDIFCGTHPDSGAVFAVDSISNSIENLFDLQWPGMFLDQNMDVQKNGLAPRFPAKCNYENIEADCPLSDSQYTWDAVGAYNGGVLLFRGSSVRVFALNVSYYETRRYFEVYESDIPLFGSLFSDTTISAFTGTEGVFGTDLRIAAYADPTNRNAPTLVFEEYNMYVKFSDSDWSKESTADVLPRIRFPHSLTATAVGVTVVNINNTEYLSVGAGLISGENSLDVIVQVFDDLGRALFLNNDLIYPVLESCGTAMSSDDETAVTTLSSVLTVSATEFAAELTGEERCEPATTATLVGTHRSGVSTSGDTHEFHFDNLAITSPGRYRLAFYHRKSKAVAYSPLIYVTESTCGSSGLAQECTLQCADLAQNPEWTIGECTIPLSGEMQWVRLEIVALQLVELTLDVEVVEPFCNSRGLACTGGASCTLHNVATTFNEEIFCDCHANRQEGFFDQRTNCVTCKIGYSGDSCTTVDLPFVTLERNFPAGEAGHRFLYAHRVQPETLFTTVIDSQQGDADFAVTFVQCPSVYVDNKLTSPLEPAEFVLPCSGRGTCEFSHDTASTSCVCDLGYGGSYCQTECCNGKGTCADDGGCTCVANDVDGHWGPAGTYCKNAECSGTAGSDVYDIDECMKLSADGVFVLCNASGPPADASRQWVSWRGLTAPTANNIEHAALVWTEAETGECSAGQKVFIYATMPKRSSPRLLEDTQTDTAWNNDGLPCNVVLSSSLGDCTNGSSYDTHSKRCLCTESDYVCLLGRCTVATSTAMCDHPAYAIDGKECKTPWRSYGASKQNTLDKDNGFCSCNTEQAPNDVLSAFHCQSGACVSPLADLTYSWSASDFLGTSYNETLLPKELQWTGAAHQNGVYLPTLFYEVASFTQKRALAGEVRSVKITDWLQRAMTGVDTELIGLSFVFVTESNSDDCQPSVGNVSLVLKDTGHRQPERLFFGREREDLSVHQNGQPFYSLYTADSDTSLGANDSDTSRNILRYQKQYWTGEANRDDATCGSGACTCPTEFAFQDPVDYVQIGEYMYFLAVADWEAATGTHGCTSPWEDGFDGEVYQGSREVFYTKGFAVDEKFESAELALPTLESERILGDSVMPDTTADSVASMKVYTRAKELTKMAYNGAEFLVFVSTDMTFADGSKDIIVADTPALWKMTLDDDGHPNLLDILSQEAHFVSYLTRITILGVDHLFFLAQLETPKTYHPTDPQNLGFNKSTINYTYLKLTRLAVWVYRGTDTAPFVMQAAAADNVGPCTAQQSHPSFIYHAGKVYFYFDDGVSGLQLYAWTNGATASVVSLKDNRNDVYLPVLPPLNKGYAKMYSTGEKLIMSLARQTTTPEPVVGGCTPLPGCSAATKLHLYQTTFTCYNESRGNVTLYAVDLSESEVKVDALLDTEELLDPVWITESTNGIFFVGHEGGAKEHGIQLTTTTPAGQAHPTPQFETQERQTLFFMKTGSYETTRVWETDAPMEMSGFVAWGSWVYFWAYDKDELALTYNDTNLDPASSTCYPPGRPQGVVWADDAGTSRYTTVMSGVNVPGYAGCKRTMYRVDAGSTEPEVVIVGTEHDGLSVPHTHCCPSKYPTAFSDASAFPDSTRVAGKMCTIGASDCSTSGEVLGALPKGCLASCAAEVTYPTALPPPFTYYTTANAWGYPHSGWWFTGYQSVWKGLSDVYRIGGFAWRDYWPRIMAVWEVQAVAVRANCEDCMDGFYGERCLQECPYPRTCSAETTQAGCKLPVCSWDNTADVCLPVQCSGSPCSDGVFGNGTCLCTEGRWGIACERTTVNNIRLSSLPVFRYGVSADTSVPLDSVYCVDCPTDASCGEDEWFCGTNNQEPCCGRSPEPLRVAEGNAAVLTFLDVTFPTAEDVYELDEVLLVLKESDGICLDKGATLTVRVFPENHVEGSFLQLVDGETLEAGFTVSLAASIPTLTAVGTSHRDLLTPTRDGKEWHVLLDTAYLQQSFSGLSNITLALTVEGSCRLMFTSREYQDTWREDCTNTCGGGNRGIKNESFTVSVAEDTALLVVTFRDPSVVPVTVSVPIIDVRQEPTVLKSVTKADLAAVSEGTVPIEIEDTLTNAASCTQTTKGSHEICDVFVPVTASFAIVTGLVYSQTASYNLTTTWVPLGAYAANALLGDCLTHSRYGLGSWSGTVCHECAARFSGESCADSVTLTCNETNCPAHRGACDWDPLSGGIFQKCNCLAGYSGVNCQLNCSRDGVGDQGCNGHGDCTELGTCVCDLDSKGGYWDGEHCDVCLARIFGANCDKTECLCSRHGTCDTTSEDGRCVEGSCKDSWSGDYCDVCTGYGSSCSVSCDDAACVNGYCAGNGSCVCDALHYKADAASECTVHCETCNDHGACAPLGSYLSHPCVCDGNWDSATNCSTCLDSHYGPTCTEECHCNLHGNCNDAGECACFQSSSTGFWSGTYCGVCTTGYSGDDCKTEESSTGTPQLGKAYSIISSESMNKAVPTGTALGAILHTNTIVIDEVKAAANSTDVPPTRSRAGLYKLLSDAQRVTATHEILLASAGERLSTEKVLLLDVWGKLLSPSFSFAGHHKGQVALHTATGSGVLLGVGVQGLFHNAGLFYAIVSDTTWPYIARFWATYNSACELCLSTIDDETFPLTQSAPAGEANCLTQICTRGQQVIRSGNRAAVVLEYIDTKNIRIRDDKNQPVVVSSSDVRPLQSVKLLDIEGAASVAVVDYSHVIDVGACILLLMKTDSVGLVSYHLSYVTTNDPDVIIQPPFAYQLTRFTTVTLLSTYVEDATVTILVMGTSTQGHIMQRYYFAKDGSGFYVFKQVLTIRPSICTVYSCNVLEKVVMTGALAAETDDFPSSSALLFVRVTLATEEDGEGNAYAVERLDMNHLKDTEDEEHLDLPYIRDTWCTKYATSEACEAGSCVWATFVDGTTSCAARRYGLIASTGRLHGIGGTGLDIETARMYLCIGAANSTVPSAVYKFDLKTFDMELSREMGFGTSSTDVEMIVAATVDPIRRALLVVTHTQRVAVALINMYDVSSITPNVSDAPTAGTQILVKGSGFSNYASIAGDGPSCLISNTAVVGKFVPVSKLSDPDFDTATYDLDNSGELAIVCKSAQPPTYTECVWSRLEVSMSVTDERWTETNTPLQRIDTPLVLSLVTRGAAWLYPHAMTVPTTANTIEDDAARAVVLEADIEVVGPTGSYNGDARLSDPRLVQLVSTGPFNMSTTIVVSGAGFVETSYTKCLINNTLSPGTFLSNLKMLCSQPVESVPVPFTTTVEVTMDGQMFSTKANSAVPYFAVGEVAALSAFVLCTITPCPLLDDDDAYVPIVKSASRVTLEPIAATLLDSIGTYVGGVWSKHDGVTVDEGTVTLILPAGLALASGSVVTKNVVAGRVVFDSVTVVTPAAGTYTVTVRYAKDSMRLVQNVDMRIEVGDATGTHFAVSPPSYSDNRDILYPQPSIRVVDIALKSVVNSQWAVHAELDQSTLPSQFLSDTGEPLILLTGHIAEVNVLNETYSFSALRLFTTALQGRNTQYQTDSIGHYTELFFNVTFTVKDIATGLAVPALSQQTHRFYLVDCSADYVGSNNLAWVEPEERYYASTEPRYIKGWKYLPIKSYYCVEREASTKALRRVVKASFLDSCTLACPASGVLLPSMYTVQPALCCGLDCADPDDQVCNTTYTSRTATGEVLPLPSQEQQSTTGFNESLIVYYVRDIGDAAEIGVWNLERDMGPAVATDHPYDTALTRQATVTVLTKNNSLSNGLRLSLTGEAGLLENELNRDDYTYKLCMYSDAVWNRASLLRANKEVVIAGKTIGDVNDWQYGDTVKRIRSDGDIDTKLRIAYIDNSTGLNGWLGAYVGRNKEIYSLKQGVEFTATQTLTLSVRPLLTAVDSRGDQLASLVSGATIPELTIDGVTQSGEFTQSAKDGYYEFGEITMPYPAKGTYNVFLSSSDRLVASKVLTFTITEGLPDHVSFDTPKTYWSNSVEGVPTTTLTNYRDLTIQPRFRLLDAAENTVTDFPSKNEVFVRIRSISPWPRCLAEKDRTNDTNPGMWGYESREVMGVCDWNTPGFTNTTAAAESLRRNNDPLFGSDGIAAYGTTGRASLNLWAKDTEYYDVVFMFYGSGLDLNGYTLHDLVLPTLTTTQCSANCNSKVCTYQPAVLETNAPDVVSRFNPHLYGQQLVVFGDYYDFAQSGSPNSSLRMEISFTLDNVQFSCEVPVGLRDPCSIDVTIPTCGYYCLNLYPPLLFTTDADRFACCNNGFRADGTTPCPNAVSSRMAAALQSSSSTLTSPSRTTVKVATSCSAGLSCADSLSRSESLAGPARVGTAAQLGVKSSDTIATFKSTATTDTLVFNITVKDRTGSDLHTLDTSTRDRIVRVYLERKSGAEWIGPDTCTTDCLRHQVGNTVCAEGSACVVYKNSLAENITSDTVVVSNGVGQLFLELTHPVSTTYGVKVVDISTHSVLPACSGPLLDASGVDLGTGKFLQETGANLPYVDSLFCVDAAYNQYAKTFVISGGVPHKMTWGSAPPSNISNSDTINKEYVIQIVDIAGNVLSADDIVDADGVPQTLMVNIESTIPQFAGDLGQALFDKRGEDFTVERIRQLQAEACAYTLLEGANGQVEFGKEAVATELRLTLASFKIWNGMQCTLNFSASTSPNTAVGEGMNLNNNRDTSEMAVTVTPNSCCDTTDVPCALFAYTFELGCYYNAFSQAKSGPNNPSTTSTSPLFQVTEASRYQCLFECGTCEEGTTCYGTGKILSTSGFYREPVSYKALSCKGSSNCAGGDVYPGIGSSTPLSVLRKGDEVRGNQQCSEGSEGPFCGVCKKTATEAAPNGYAKSQKTCAKCASKAMNYFFLCLGVVVILIVILVMVATNLQTGEIVRETSKLSTMLKMLMNHIQVIALSSSFAVQWGDMVSDMFSVGENASPSATVLSVSCISDLSYYTLYVGWMILPIVVIVVPGLIVLFIQLKRQLKEKGKEGDLALKEKPPECQSIYHWAYDWSVNEADKESLHQNLREYHEMPSYKKKQHKLNLEVKSCINPRNIPDLASLGHQDSFPHVNETHQVTKLQGIHVNTTKDHTVEDMETRWETEFTQGSYGCWLCQRCCVLEQLFPTGGVGRVGVRGQYSELIAGKWYTCDVASHFPSETLLHHLFQADLLVACLSRLRLLRTLEARFIKAGRRMIEEDVSAAASELFGPDGTDGAVTKLETKEREKCFNFAVATLPPYPIPQHKPFNFPRLEEAGTGGVSKPGMQVTVNLDNNITFAKYSTQLISLKTRVDEAVAHMLIYTDADKKGADNSVGLVDDFLRAENVSSAGNNSIFMYARTDLVLGTINEYTSGTDPITPPRSPKGGQELSTNIALPTAFSCENIVPKWYLEAEFDYLLKEQKDMDDKPKKNPLKFLTLEGRSPQTAGLGTPEDGVLDQRSTLFKGKLKEALLPVHGGKQESAAFTLTDVSSFVPYDQLYAAARLRRMSDKINEWKSRGYPEDEIKRKLTSNLDVQDASLVNGQDWKKKLEKVNNLFSEKDASRARTSQWDDGDQDFSEIKSKKRIQKLDRELEVIQPCKCCSVEFAIVYCPMCNAYYCQACDRSLHWHGPRRNHQRVVPQPRRSPLTEAGYKVQLRLTDIYTVTVIIVIFLIYPSLMREVVVMLSCTVNICTSEDKCDSYLEEDASVDCSVSPYPVFQSLSVAALFLYGLGLPLLAYLRIRKHRNALRTKAVLSTLGFLYSGFRQKWYFWECIIMLRKMFLIIIIVTLTRYPSYQLYASMWLMAVFTLLNVLVKPFKYAKLWHLENLSLVSITITYNVALIYLDEPSSVAKAFVNWGIFLLTIVVFAVFLYHILTEFRNEVFQRVQEEVGGTEVSCDTLGKYLTKNWKAVKPNVLLNAKERIQRELESNMRRRWQEASNHQRRGDGGQAVMSHSQDLGGTLTPAGEMGFWMEYYASTESRAERFLSIQQLGRGYGGTRAAVVRSRGATLTEVEMSEMWSNIFDTRTV